MRTIALAMAALAFGCSPRTDHATSRASNVAAGDSAMDAAASSVPSATRDVDDSDAYAYASGTDGGAAGDVDGAVAAAKHYARVLHIGDSTVGGNGGLAKALKARFTDVGTKYVSDTTVSLAISTFAHTPAFKKALVAQDPDLVLITLGTNDVFIPNPASLASAVQAIAAKSQVGRPEGRACVWIGPPTWKPDTGIVEIIRENAAPCRFFDSSHMVGVARAGDGIHPTDKGGDAWASLVWTFLQTDGKNSAPAEPWPADAGAASSSRH